MSLLPTFPQHDWIRIGITLVCMLFAVPSLAQIESLQPEPGSTLTSGTEIRIEWNYGATTIPITEQMIVEYAILPDNGPGGVQFFGIALLPWDGTETVLNVPTVIPADATLLLRFTETDNAGDGTIVGSVQFEYPLEIACNTPVVEPLKSVLNVCTNSRITIGVKEVPSAKAYRWFQGDAFLRTTDVSTIDLRINGEADFGMYRVDIEDSCGALSGITDVTLVKEHDAPLVTRQPFVTASVVCTGSEVRFGANAAGESLRYQWLKNGEPIDGATAIPYVIPNVGKHHQGVYALRVTGACGFVTVSENVSLTVITRPTILRHPRTLSVCSGGSATLTVEAIGSNLTYQWRKNGTPIQGADRSTLSIASVGDADLGTYDCVVTSLEQAPAGCDRTVTSAPARLIQARSPVITQQPTAVTACIGENFSMTVKANGTDLSYQWYLNDVAIEGQSTSTLTISSVEPTSAGRYHVVVVNPCGTSIQSEEINLSVQQRPAVVEQPADVSVVAGGTLRLGAKAVRATTVDWYREGVLVASTSDGILVLENIPLRLAGTYSAVARNGCGDVMSKRVTVTVLPVIEPTPLLAISSTALDFGSAPIGQRGDTSRTLTLRNTGNAPLAISKIEDPASAPYPFGFAEVIVLPIRLAPGEQVEIPIEFTPVAAGLITRTLTVESNDPNGPVTVELFGKGRLYYEGIANIEFPVTRIGASTTSCLELSNATDEDIVLQSAEINGAQAPIYALETTFPVVIPANGIARLCVRFSPTTTEASQATILVNSTRGGNALVNLTGKGSIVSSVRESSALDVAMAPNPTTGMITFHVYEPSTVRISTMHGLVIAEFAIEGKATMNLAEYSLLAQGTYAVTVTSKGGSKTMLLQIAY